MNLPKAQHNAMVTLWAKGRSMQENWNLSRRKSMGVALLSLASAKEEAEAEVSTLFMIVNSLIFFIE